MIFDKLLRRKPKYKRTPNPPLTDLGFRSPDAIHDLANPVNITFDGYWREPYGMEVFVEAGATYGFNLVTRCWEIHHKMRPNHGRSRPAQPNRRVTWTRHLDGFTPSGRN